MIKIDTTIPEFFDNVDKAGITEFPWVIAFADKVPYYKGPYGDKFDQEFGGKNQGYRDMLEALKAKDGEAKEGDQQQPPQPQGGQNQAPPQGEQQAQPQEFDPDAPIDDNLIKLKPIMPEDSPF